MQLMGPLSEEHCVQMFGEKYKSGNNRQNSVQGFWGGGNSAMTPAKLGCGTTSVQAGILEQ